MDSKWGGIIIAALAGLGIGAFITHEKSPKAMKAEMVEPEIEEESEEPFDKRPQLDDFVEMNVAKMVEHLKWLQQHPQFNKRNMQVNKLLNDPNNGLQKVLDSYNIKRRKDDKREFPPLEFHNYTVYADKYGKCPEGYLPTGEGWKTGDCIKILEDGTEIKLEREKEIGSGGPLNTFFQRSGYLKHDTPKAMLLARETLHETGKYYSKDDDPSWEYKDPLEKLRAQYFDPKIQEEVMDSQTLDQYAHWLWLEQFTKNNRKDLRTQGFFMPFDIDTCRRFLEYLYVENTYQGYLIEERAIDDMTYSYMGMQHPIYRFVEEDGNNTGDGVKIHAYDDIVVTFTGESMDIWNKIDLFVRPNLGLGDIVLGGVQVKPLSFFSKDYLVRKMITTHRKVGEGKNHRKSILTLPQEGGVGVPKTGMVKPKGSFNVQTLVYDDNTLEWLNYDAVMQRIRFNIPDPMLTDLPTWKNTPKHYEDGRNEVKAFFENQRQVQEDEVIRKNDEYVSAYTGLQKLQEEQAKIQAQREADKARIIKREEQRIEDQRQAVIEENKKQARRQAAKDDYKRKRKERDRKERENPRNIFKQTSNKKKPNRRGKGGRRR
jgi:hypothetical protein